MGTRASFFIGDPREVDDNGVTKAEWLGCICFDGNPTSFEWPSIETEQEFRDFVANGPAKLRHFASPTGGWPFPWVDDIFVTDWTYAFFDGEVKVASFHDGMFSVNDYIELTAGDDGPDGAHDLMSQFEDAIPEGTVSIGKAYDRSQPDSILYMSAIGGV